eukprot:sb/3474295/
MPKFFSVDDYLVVPRLIIQSDPDLVTSSGERVLVTKSGWPLNRGEITLISYIGGNLSCHLIGVSLNRGPTVMNIHKESSVDYLDLIHGNPLVVVSSSLYKFHKTRVRAILAWVFLYFLGSSQNYTSSSTHIHPHLTRLV